MTTEGACDFCGDPATLVSRIYAPASRFWRPAKVSRACRRTACILQHSQVNA